MSFGVPHARASANDAIVVLPVQLACYAFLCVCMRHVTAIVLSSAMLKQTRRVRH